MSFITDFQFNNMDRIGNDNCCLTQNEIQNTSLCNYLLQNYTLSDCSMTNTKDIATSQPGINYSGSFGFGGCNVDENSDLIIGGIQTHPKSRIDLFGRTFATVPFLGRGPANPILESQMQQGEDNTNRRTITRLTEKSYLPRHTTPLIPEIRQRIQQSSNLIEHDAVDGWIRGGVPSRELSKDRDFYN